MEFGIATSLARGLNRAIGSNDPRLTPMYNKYGYYRNPEIPRFDNKSVAFVSDVVIADFRELPEPTNSNVQSIGKKFKKGGFFCICQHKECSNNGYFLENKEDCPLQNKDGITA